MTPTQFKSHIRTSIANEALQIALDNNTQRRLKGRAAAFESLPDWRERRQRAHTVRADVIAHLDEYLNKFTAKVQENGIVVHRAKDAAEAINFVLKIIGWKPNLVAKSKSMSRKRSNSITHSKPQDIAWS